MAGVKPASQMTGDAIIAAQAARLRKRCEGPLLTGSPPPPASSSLPRRAPRLLARCDGSDIIKKNAARKKKYLFSFPGSLKIPPHGRIGTLSGLDTTAPTLDIVYVEGRLRLRGSLVFPKNSVLTLKGGAGRGKPVRVIDTFETLVVFSEWSWLGLAADNPGDVGKPLPATMQGTGGKNFWRPYANHQHTASKSSYHQHDVAAALMPSVKLLRAKDIAVRYPSREATLPRRSNPRRSKRPDFSTMGDESDDDLSPMVEKSGRDASDVEDGPEEAVTKVDAVDSGKDDDSESVPLASTERDRCKRNILAVGSGHATATGDVITIGDTPERPAPFRNRDNIAIHHSPVRRRVSTRIADADEAGDDVGSASARGSGDGDDNSDGDDDHDGGEDESENEVDADDGSDEEFVL